MPTTMSISPLAAGALAAGAAALSLAAAAAVHRLAAPRNHAPAVAAARACETAIVTRGAVSGILTVPGRLTFERVVRVGSAAAGRVLAVGPGIGERVQAGEVLALLERRIIRAPLAGVVLDRSIEPGESIAPSPPAPPLFTVGSDPSRLAMEIALDERHVAEVRPGPVTFTAAAARPQRTFEATVRQVSLAAAGGAAYRALLDVPNPDGLLRPGMSALVDIPMVSLSEALHVPAGALRSAPDAAGNSDGDVVWLAGDGGRPFATPVRVGVADGELAEVEGPGLASGRVVVTDASPTTCLVAPPVSPFAGGSP
jgi:HlyD family secretion protein